MKTERPDTDECQALSGGTRARQVGGAGARRVRSLRAHGGAPRSYLNLAAKGKKAAVNKQAPLEPGGCSQG